MARRTIAVGLAQDVERLGRPINSGLHYIGGRFDYSSPFSDAFLADVYAAFRACHIPSLDQRVFLAAIRSGESHRRIAEQFHICPTTVSASVARTTKAILAWPHFGFWTVLFEEMDNDLRAIGELFN